MGVTAFSARHLPTDAVLSPGTVTALPLLASIPSPGLPYRRSQVFVKIDRMPCRNFEKGIKYPVT